MRLLELFPVVLLILVVAGITGVVKRRIRAHGVLVLMWRWHSGDTWHGRPVTDAGWFRPGTKALTPTGHAPRFHHRPRWQRAAWRTTPSLVLLVTGWGLLFYETAALAVLAVSAVSGFAAGCWRTIRWWQRMKHRRTWVEPAHLVAAPLVGIAVASDSSWLQIAPDRSSVTAALPAAYNPDAKQRERLVDTLTGKLGIEAPDVRWHLAGPAPTLTLTASKPPPELVTLADVLPAIKDARPDELVWGIGKRGKVIKSSLSGDSPHVGLSMGSGAGKSVTARAIAAQMLYHGAIALIIDFKMISHQWARNLPNAVIARRPHEIHAALLWLGAELERRNEVALAGADDEGQVHAVVGPRIVVILEELNATVNRLRRYWATVREKPDPARSPALDALDAASFMGRQVLCNLVYIGQRLSVRAIGGDGDARESIAVVALGRYSASAWKMLAGDHPMPPKSLTPGRLQVVGGEVSETQAVKLSAAEAQELAVSGVVSPLPYGMPGARAATGETVSRPMLKTGPDLEFATVSSPIAPVPVSGGVTLSEARAAGMFGALTMAGVRTARHRDPAFPSHVSRRGVALEYDPDALADWYDSRKGAR